MMSASAQLRRAATAILRHATTRRAALRIAALGSRSLVLVYHRIAPEGAAAHEIVRSLPSTLFRQHLDALSSLGEIVPLAQLLETPDSTERPRFAITFDDDDVGHVKNALPVLQAAEAPATFFLSGRALHDLPPYWWTVLEHSIRLKGLDHTCDALGLRRMGGRRPMDLAAAVEGTPLAAQITNLLPTPGEPAMGRPDIRRLVEAGMAVGFHTLDHPILTMLCEPDLDAAMIAGRRELAAAAGTAVDFLAYPHGRANAAVTLAAKRAPFVAAWATGGRPITHRSDRFVLGRWDPEALPVNDFVAAVAVRLLRSPHRRPA
jgi:peptidoglycan/xylan/chitin deacetylase (PgdA/CDA1 family)